MSAVLQPGFSKNPGIRPTWILLRQSSGIYLHLQVWNTLRLNTYLPAGYFENPEWLVDITVQDFLELEGIDEITIPGMLRELILAAEELSRRPDCIAALYLLPAEVPIHPFDSPQPSYYLDEEDETEDMDLFEED